MIRFTKLFFTTVLLGLSLLISLGNSSCDSKARGLCMKAYSTNRDVNGCVSYCPSQVQKFFRDSKGKKTKSLSDSLEAACYAGQYGVIKLNMRGLRARIACKDRYGLGTDQFNLCIDGAIREELRKAQKPSGTGRGGEREGGRETGMITDTPASPSSASSGSSSRF